MSVADFARMRLIDESLRFPLLISLKEAIAAEDAVTLTRLGFAGIVLASQGTAEQIGTQIQSLREALEQVPTPKGEKGDVRLGGFASIGDVEFAQDVGRVGETGGVGGRPRRLG
jgi:hypothetical protein